MPVITPSLLNLGIIINRYQTEKFLQKSSLQSIYLKKTDAKWIKSRKEIFINGDFFDVKEISENEKGLLITGIFDKTETSLQKKVNDLYQRKKDLQDLIVLKYLQLVFNGFSETAKQELKIQVFNLQNYTHNTSSHVDDILLKVPSPPPKA